MSIESLPAPIFIARPAALERLARLLRGEAIIAVDTESNSLFAYQEQVCLIQFSAGENDYLVDPLALDDLSILGPIFSDPRIEKVFHAAEYDLICLRRDFGFEFANIFDTMIAARILGRDAVGLGSILEADFGVHVDKRHQRANWGRRPIPQDLLSYAQLDTHHLIEMRNRMQAELREKSLWALAAEDFARVTYERQVNGENGREIDNNKGVDCWRVNGARDLHPQQAAVLLELCRYRNQAARHANRPLFKIMGDRTLLAIAERCPEDMKALGQIKGMSGGQLSRHGREVLNAVQRGLKAPHVHPPQSRRPDDAYLRRLDGLREWRKRTALRMGVPSDVVLPRDLMMQVAEGNPREQGELARMMESVPWRLERWGMEILRVVGD